LGEVIDKEKIKVEPKKVKWEEFDIINDINLVLRELR